MRLDPEPRIGKLEGGGVARVHFLLHRDDEPLFRAMVAAELDRLSADNWAAVDEGTS